MTSVKKIISRSLINIPGWHTRRKIVVIESDDWGSIRMPSKEVYEKCLKAGYPVDLNPYERYDSIASEDDLEILFELLSRYKDKNGNHPVMTANCVVANPDFEKIKNEDFKNYHYELITETFKRYPKHKRNFELWIQGKDHGIFYPQFHAREHLNVSLFMNALKNGNKDVLFGFKNRMPGSISFKNPKNGNEYVEATKFYSLLDRENKLEILIEGLELFEQLFKYKSQSYIPTNYIVSSEFYPAIYNRGVKYVQGIKVLFEPDLKNNVIKHKRYLGQKDKSGIINLVRNCRFEPTLFPGHDEVDNCLNDVRNAFLLNKPAIISSHRLNYVGYIDEVNRDNNLKSFKKLIQKMLVKWPDLEFMTSEDLGRVIENDKILKKNYESSHT